MTLDDRQANQGGGKGSHEIRHNLIILTTIFYYFHLPHLNNGFLVLLTYKKV